LLGYRRANLELANHLYKTPTSIKFIQIKEDLIIQLMETLKNLKNEVTLYYEHDEVLLYETDQFIKVCRRVVGSVQNYSIFFEGNNAEIIKYFTFTKRSIYSDLYEQMVKPIIGVIKILRNQSHNGYLEKLAELVTQLPKENVNVYIITKHRLSEEVIKVDEREMKILRDKEFIDSGIFVDCLFFIGTPSYYDRKFSEVFYAKEIVFLGYSCFENRLVKNESFSYLIKKDLIINTVYRDLIIEKGFVGTDYRTTFDTPLEKQDVERITTELGRKIVPTSEKVEAKLATISNGLYILLPVSQKINVLNRETLKVHQEPTKTIAVGDLLVFRSQNGSTLIRDVADQIIGEQATFYREHLEKWKKKLRSNVEKKGVSIVSKILRIKYQIKTATENNVKNWISSYSIKPNCLKEILDVFNFEEQQKQEILRSADLIFRAHISAGHKISQSLMQEMNLNLENILDEKGFYTFESKEFEGASFNIEEIYKVSKETYLVPEQDVLKVLKRGGGFS
jgi:hypothetical protein